MERHVASLSISLQTLDSASAHRPADFQRFAKITLIADKNADK
jgi:hypothetical protein